MTKPHNQAAIDAITALAEEIARTSPECADRSMEIIRLLRGLEGGPDRGAIEDAIEAGTDGDLSDTQVRNASNAVVRTMREQS
jgi:hypothetical protein